MDFALTDQQEAIRDAIAKICEGFPDAYWLKKDHDGGFPHDFHKALADAGWLGISACRKPMAAPGSASPKPRS
ncbi:alkylation response protein AidB-like acyl-CoA dehydrogenase [Bradyrhizobium sp. LB7.1]